jgi:Flp pilus assembly protein TadB
MLNDRDLCILAEIEARMITEAPGLARLLRQGGRFALLLRPEPQTVRGLAAVFLTVALSAVAVVTGFVAAAVPLIAVGLIGAIVLPLPVWLVCATRRRSAVYE